ncbi:MAG: glycosyltransferase family 2 protein [Deltaproteobacteria bacterium]|nr:glycosyltransferase family 2 protein [Deltaproteobacteria bacterium]
MHTDIKLSSQQLNSTRLLSVIIPVYNEARSIELVIQWVRATCLAGEIIVVDDGSTDNTVERVSKLKSVRGLKLVRHRGNRGKGAAIRTGLDYATGEYLIIQDADLELDPADYPALLAPLIANQTNVVYGVRKGDNLRRGPLLFLGVRLLTLVTNLLYGCHIHDEATGYKVFRLSLLRRIVLECEGFEFCPEITAKVCRLGERIYEVPVSYHPRQASGGKKIRATDGIIALLTLVRYRFQPRRKFDREYEVEKATVPAPIADQVKEYRIQLPG